MQLQSDINLESIVSQIPENFTGADFSALTTESYMIAVKERVQEIESEIESYKIKQNMK